MGHAHGLGAELDRDGLGRALNLEVRGGPMSAATVSAGRPASDFTYTLPPRIYFSIITVRCSMAFALRATVDNLR
jgi:hypothetical protein